MTRVVYVPPVERRARHPPEPESSISKRGEAVLLWLIAVFLLAMLFAPIAGGTLIQALLAVLQH